MHETNELEPLFMPRSLFERAQLGTWTEGSWTKFESALFNLLTHSNASKGLIFSKRLRIVDAMREAGIRALEEIEQP